MSAWMSGIGLGLQAAQMEQQRNQQAQELAFRQQQAGINNAQEDRRFEAAQTADVRDFDAMQQWRAFQRQQQEQQYQMQRDEIARDLAMRKANAAIFGAASTPYTPAVPGGTGPAPQHALDGITDDIMMNASPEALRAMSEAKRNNAAYAQRMAMERNKVAMARADGSIKNASPEQADVWRSFGWYDDGTIMPDEFPLSLKQQQQERQDKLAGFLATERDQNGDFVSNPQVFEHYRSIPLDIVEKLFDRKVQYDQAMNVARIRAQGSLDVANVNAQAKAAKAAAGPTIPQRLSMAKATLATAQKEYLAAAGKNGKAGILAEPTQADYDLAATAKGDIDAGWWDPTGPQQSEVDAAKKKVAAWEKYKAAADAVDGVRMSADTDISQRGVLDGPPSETRSDLPPDENTIYELFRQKHGREPHQGDIDELEAIERSMNTGG